jgi:hypothetical protein
MLRDDSQAHAFISISHGLTIVDAERRDGRGRYTSSYEYVQAFNKLVAT